MTTGAAKARSEWEAPVEDGEAILWPEAGELIRQTRENHALLGSADGVFIQKIALSELRSRAREWLGHREGGQLLIATGHQVELLHPGVWAKDVVIDALAGRMEGAAYHVAVDTDSPKHLQVRLPGVSVAVTDDARLNVAAWSGLLRSPTTGHLQALSSIAGKACAQWGYQALLGDFLAAMKGAGAGRASLAEALTQAMQEMNRRLGLRQRAVLAGPMWGAEPYLVFAHHALARAESFAQGYNAVLTKYRQENGIRSGGRPWPDLKVDGDRCETPFWLDDVSAGERERAQVVRKRDRWVLELKGGGGFALDEGAEGWRAAEQLGRALTQSGARLSPRALMLTAFVRLLVADQFVHGIGGGQYDRVTDRVISGWFGVRAPAFSVATATLLFPTAVGQRRVDVRPLTEEGRRLRHGWADTEKMRVERQIAAAPRRSGQRQELFRLMHRRLAEAMERREYKEWERRMEAAWRVSEEQEGIFDRELFYLIQPAERLRKLIGLYNGWIGQA